VHPATFELRRRVSGERSLLHHALKYAQQQHEHLTWYEGLSLQGREIFEQSKRDLEALAGNGGKDAVEPIAPYLVPDFNGLILSTSSLPDAIEIKRELSDLGRERDHYIAGISAGVRQGKLGALFVEGVALLAGSDAPSTLKQVMPEIFPTEAR